MESPILSMKLLTLYSNNTMGELLKFVTKVLLGSTAVGAGAALIKNGTENARNINIFRGKNFSEGQNKYGNGQR